MLKSARTCAGVPIGPRAEPTTDTASLVRAMIVSDDGMCECLGHFVEVHEAAGSN